MVSIVSQNKFQRTYFLRIEGNDGKTYSIGSEDGLVPYLSLEFSVKRDILAATNTGSFRIRNISPSIRGQLYQDWYNVPNMKQMELKAGYVGSPLSTVFRGLINSATSFREEGSVDFITELEGQDYSMITSTSFSNLNIASPQSSNNVSQQQVIASLIKDLQAQGQKLGKPLSVGLVGSYPGTHYIRYQNIGNTWELLQTETQKTCYIDSGKIFCIPNNLAFEGDVTLISSDTGLLGVPRIFGSFLVVEILFEPGLIPGQSVYLDTTSLSQFNSNLNGTYKITSVQHSGTISQTVSGKCKTIATLQLTVNQIQKALNISVPLALTS